MSNNKRYPFKYLDSYTREDGDVYFGREKEVEKLYEMTFQSNLLLIYGASGTGKTSLIQCGLANCLETYNWLPLTIRRNADINQSLEYALNKAIESKDEDKGKSYNSLSLVQKIEVLRMKYFRPVYLIFDQFEELYIGENKKEQEIFYQSIKELLLLNQHVKVIISMREEYLAHLYDFEKIVPVILRKKLRVEAMSRENIKEVLDGIGKNSLVSFKEEESDDFIDKIFERLGAGTDGLDLPSLQILFDKLYLNITNDRSYSSGAEFSITRFEEMGDFGDVLLDLLKSLVKKCEVKYGIKDIYIWSTLTQLTTLQGTKQARSKTEIQVEGLRENERDKILSIFESERILLANGQGKYEFRHDALAKRVYDNNEVKIKIEEQLQRKVEDKESLTETFLNDIDRNRKELNISNVQEKWIAKSRAKNKKEKRIKTAVIISVLSAFLLLIILWSISINKKNNSLLTSQSLLLSELALQQLESGDATTALMLALEALPKSTQERGRSFAQRAEGALRAIGLYLENSRYKSLSIVKNPDGFLHKLEFNPQHSHIFLTVGGNDIHVWDSNNGNKILQIIHTSSVNSAVFSNDGERILFSSLDGVFKLWSIVENKEIASFDKVEMNLQPNPLLSPDDSYIATYPHEKSAKIWDAKTGDFYFEIPSIDQISSMKFSIDGEKIFISSGQKIKVWDLYNKKELYSLKGSLEVFGYGSRMNQNGKKILVHEQDSHRNIASPVEFVKVVDVETGSCINKIETQKYIKEFFFSPDNSQIVLCLDDAIDVFDTETCEKLKTIQLDYNRSLFNVLEYSPSNKYICLGTGKDLILFDAKTGVEEGRLNDLFNAGDGIRSISFSKDETKVIFISNENTARVWDWRTNEIFTLRGHQRPLWIAEYNPVGDRIITASEDKTIRIWNTESNDSVFPKDTISSYYGINTFSPNGKYFLYQSGTKNISLYNYNTFNKLFDLRIEEVGSFNAKFSPDSKKLLTSFPMTSQLWDLESGNIVHSWGSNMCTFNFSPDSKKIIGISSSQVIEWNLDDQYKQTIISEGNRNYEFADYSPDNKRIVFQYRFRDDNYTGNHYTNNCTATHFLDSKSHEEVFVLNDTCYSHFLFNPNGSQFILYNDINNMGYKKIRLYNLSNFELKKELDDDIWFTNINYTNTGNRLIASSSGSFRLWDTFNGQEIIVPEEYNISNQVVLSNDGERIIICSGYGPVTIWNSTDGSKIAHLGGHLGWVWYQELNHKYALTPSDKQLILWDMETYKKALTLKGYNTVISNPVDNSVLLETDREFIKWKFPEIDTLINKYREYLAPRTLTSEEREEYLLSL